MRPRSAREVTTFGAGAVTVVLILVACFVVFAHVNPFRHEFKVNAVFANASSIHQNSPVRIAGVNVGKVKDIVPAGGDSSAAKVTMEIEKQGLPIYQDARMKIRPRIFLEGNFFVDVQPGTPGAKKLKSGATIPVTQTSAPVQFDQLLTSLQAGTRRNLQVLIQGYGNALDGQPLPGEDKANGADKSTVGETAAKSLNDSLRTAPRALRGTSIVNQALLGTQEHDLSRLIAGTQKVMAALSTNESSLQDLITNFNTTTAAFASQAGNLRQTIHLLPGVLQKLNPTLDHLNASFPPTRAFAKEILPGVRETPATIDAAFPWIKQTRALVSPAELQGLVHDLQPSIHDLAKVTDDSTQLLPQVDLVNRCVTGVILPTGDVKINDGFFTTGIENYKEFWQTMVGLSGEGQNFDGNGEYTRFQPGGGTNTVSTGNVAGTGPLFGNAPLQPLGSRPAMPAQIPPKKRNVPCYTNPLPNLNAATTGPGP
jgi:phospholipid/cholesterol/gamma-HCH transport system substrate-binding protein